MKEVSRLKTLLAHQENIKSYPATVSHDHNKVFLTRLANILVNSLGLEEVTGVVNIFYWFHVGIKNTQLEFPLFLPSRVHTISGTHLPPACYPKIFQLKNASRSCLEKAILQYHTRTLIGKLSCVIRKLKNRYVCMQGAFLLFCG